METFYSTLYMSNSSIWSEQDSQSSNWTREENKLFESALAIYDKETPDRWVKIANMIPGKSEIDVKNQYRDLEDDVSNIEAGRVPIPGYHTPSFTLELVDDRDFEALRKRSASMARASEHEKKKGVPWTEDEHKRFLLGLLKHGKGDWRSISRNFVFSKTPTQVASHAQKYFIRLKSDGKDKRRPSIHDITTNNLTDSSFSEDSKPPISFDQSVVLPPHNKSAAAQRVVVDWNHQPNEAVMVFNPTYGNVLMPSQYDIAAHGLKLRGSDLFGIAYRGARVGPQNPMFQFQSARYQIRG